MADRMDGGRRPTSGHEDNTPHKIHFHEPVYDDPTQTADFNQNMRVQIMAERRAKGLDIWTGEQLTNTTYADDDDDE